MHLRRPLLLLGIMLAVVLSLIASARGIGPPPLPYHGAFGHGPTIALVHGLGSRPEHWLPTARLLAREHRVVLVDLPGHGETPMATPLSLDRAADALDAALADASSEPVVLVGHSVGGLVAAAEAIRNPARVRALVLVDTALEPQLSGAARAAMLAAVGAGYDA